MERIVQPTYVVDFVEDVDAIKADAPVVGEILVRQVEADETACGESLGWCIDRLSIRDVAVRIVDLRDDFAVGAGGPFVARARGACDLGAECRTVAHLSADRGGAFIDLGDLGVEIAERQIQPEATERQQGFQLDATAARIVAEYGGAETCSVRI